MRQRLRGLYHLGGLRLLWWTLRIGCRCQSLNTTWAALCQAQKKTFFEKIFQVGGDPGSVGEGVVQSRGGVRRLRPEAPYSPSFFSDVKASSSSIWNDM